MLVNGFLDWNQVDLAGRGLSYFFLFSCGLWLELYLIIWIFRIEDRLGVGGVISRFHNIVAEHMVKAERTNAVLFLVFPEMNEESFDRHSHSAWVLKFEAIWQASQIKEF